MITSVWITEFQFVRLREAPEGGPGEGHSAQEPQQSEKYEGARDFARARSQGDAQTQTKDPQPGQEYGAASHLRPVGIITIRADRGVEPVGSHPPVVRTVEAAAGLARTSGWLRANLAP